MPINVDIDLSGMEAKLSDARLEGIQEQLTQSVLVDTDPFVPKRTGTMASSAHLTSPTSFTYEPFYSTYVYNGTRYIKPREWIEPSKAANLGDWKEEVARDITSGI